MHKSIILKVIQDVQRINHTANISGVQFSLHFEPIVQRITTTIPPKPREIYAEIQGSQCYFKDS